MQHPKHSSVHHSPHAGFVTCFSAPFFSYLCWTNITYFPLHVSSTHGSSSHTHTHPPTAVSNWASLPFPFSFSQQDSLTRRNSFHWSHIYEQHRRRHHHHHQKQQNFKTSAHHLVKFWIFPTIKQWKLLISAFISQQKALFLHILCRVLRSYNYERELRSKNAQVSKEEVHSCYTVEYNTVFMLLCLQYWIIITERRFSLCLSFI